MHLGTLLQENYRFSGHTRCYGRFYRGSTGVYSLGFRLPKIRGSPLIRTVACSRIQQGFSRNPHQDALETIEPVLDVLAIRLLVLGSYNGDPMLLF